MGAWYEGPFLAVDTETTGVDVSKERIVEIATAVVEPDGTIESSWSTVVNPGVPVPDEAAAIHGITTARCRAEGMSPEAALRRVARYLRTQQSLPVVIYNAKFDLPLLLHESVRHSVEFPGVPLVLDPYVIDKGLDRYRKGSRKLIDTARFYGVELDEADAHGALADAVASARLMHQIVTTHPVLRQQTLTEVFMWSVAEAEEQRESFVDYRRRSSDPQFDIPAGWPLPSRAVA